MNHHGWTVASEGVALVVGLVMMAAMAPTSLVSAGEVLAETQGVTTSPPSTSESAPHVLIRANYGQLPLHFEANQGQTDSRVKFLARGSGATLLLTSNEMLLHLQQADTQPRPVVARQRAMARRLQSGAYSAAQPAPHPLQRLLHVHLTGVNPAAQMMGVEELPGKVHYLVGHDPTQWRTHIPTYAQVHYQDIFPGIDLFLSGHQQLLEWNFVVAPRADPRRISLALKERDAPDASPRRQALLLDADGQLRPRGPSGAWHLRQPQVSQDVDGVKHMIPAVYRLPSLPREADEGDESNRLDVHVDSYDTDRPLTVTLSLSYSSYLGGADADSGVGLAVDQEGHAYITGFTTSSDFPQRPPGSLPMSDDSGYAFVAKLNAAGTALIYSMVLGGRGSDGGTGIAVDDDGHAYVVGETSSPDFPTTPAAFQPDFSGGSREDFSADGFVAKLTADGSGLVYASYLGGSDDDLGADITVDAAGYVYVTGETSSADFPTTVDAVQPTFGGGFLDAFVAKIDVDGSALVYASYVGGSGDDAGRGIAVDATGHAYLVGDTDSPDFPTPMGEGASPPELRGGSDAFVTKLAADGSALHYVTYIGGSDSDFGHAIALDTQGHAYVTGSTFSVDLPVTAGSFQANFGGGFLDAFVAKLEPDGAGLVYASYLGGDADDVGEALAVDAAGHVYVTGLTESSDFPTRHALQENLAGSFDAFVTKIAPDGSSLAYSTYLGGSEGDRGFAIAINAHNHVYVTGLTQSSDFKTANPLQPHGSHVLDAFITRIVEGPDEPCQQRGPAALLGVLTFSGDRIVFPVHSVHVSLQGPDGCRDVTPSNTLGLYLFRELAFGTYNVRPDQDGCVFDPPSKTVELVGHSSIATFSASCR